MTDPLHKDPEEPHDHSLNDVWQHLTDGQKERSQIKADVSSVKTDIAGIKSQISDIVPMIRAAIQRPRTEWGWVIAGVMLLGVVIGLYVTPVQRQTEANTNAILKLVEMAYDDRVGLERRIAKVEEWERIH